MTDIIIGSTCQDQQINKIRVLNVAENPKSQSSFIIYRKNKGKKPIRSFYDMLLETTQRKEMM